MHDPALQQPNTIASLDGWRAVAILIVFLSHAGLGNFVPGGLGVTIFFFLSGYLITTLMRKEHLRSGSLSIARFYARRALRLLPPLFLTVSLAYPLVYLGFLDGGYSVQGYFAQLLYFANYYSLFFDLGNSTPTGTAIFWSLAVEEHFYLVFPLVFALLYAKHTPTRLVALLIAVCVAVLMWRYWLVVNLGADESRTYFATDTRIDSIIYGCLLALVCNPLNNPPTNSKLPVHAYVLLASAVGLLLFSIVYRNATFRETGRYTLQGMALAPLFFYSIRYPQHTLFKALNCKLVKQLGLYSYSFYLVHFIALKNLQLHADSPMLSAVLAFAVAWAFAALVDRYIDRPMAVYKRRFAG